MRTLVLLRGLPGVGKSTWIKEQKLDPYTLSADQIRLLRQPPQLTVNGKLEITSKHDHKVWSLLFDLLKARMERGDFTVIDATHVTSKSISQYKSLATTYRYRVFVVDFTSVPLETALLQNRSREPHKIVPEKVLYQMSERLKSEKVPSWVTVLSPEEYQHVMTYKPRSYDQYEAIHLFGDIHGCYTAFMTYMQGDIKEDELYIFTGDLLDRGIENVKVLEWMLAHKDCPNVIVIEGNHDQHLYKFAHGDEVRSNMFNRHTAPQIEEAQIDLKEVRKFVRTFHQLAYFTYHGQTFLITHGGLSHLPKELLHISTQQLIHGVGEYSDDIDHLFDQNTKGQDVIQIHGHRNLYRLPIKAAERSYNLEGQVEFGGKLRVVSLTDQGINTHEIENHVFKPSTKNQAPSIAPDISLDDFLNHLDQHEYVQELKLPNHISSFNFTKKAFSERQWDDVNVKARGLFVNMVSKEIVSRSYNKFFNIDERPETRMQHLVNHLQFPVTVYDKANGYLGTVGFNDMEDELIFTSKSYTSHVKQNQHASWVETLFYQTFDDVQVDYLKNYLHKHQVSLVFEVILPEKDPHIIDYDHDHLILLDIVKRQLKYEKLPYSEVKRLSEQLDILCKKEIAVFNDWTLFYKWYHSVSTDETIKEEGFVIEDDHGFMTKLKLPYYQFWKQMRGIKQRVAQKRSPQKYIQALQTAEHARFYTWLLNQDPDEVGRSSIIELRRRFVERESAIHE
ncbi:RNA ligase [Bacillus sp. NPDC077027]|uniref:RNA ligase n=1 Tax=Bacillus sp. NPDC077027 TaxID=3390548 RepID=UPI003D053806